MRFHPDKLQVAIYNLPFIYRLSSDHTLSITKLSQALQLLVLKHLSLRTSLVFHQEKNILLQQIIDVTNSNQRLFTFIESTFETDEQLENIIQDEKRNSQHFNLFHGLVFRCHIVYYQQISPDHLLSNQDVLIFNFHHALFDFPSMNLFLHDLNQIYTTGQPSTNDDDFTLRYLDCKYK